MKFFHLSDLHIGLKLYNRDLGEDQAYILRQIIRLAAEERPDALVIAGDIYDRAVPPAEAVELFDRFITELTDTLPKLSVMLIAGNHDSGPPGGLSERHSLPAERAYDRTAAPDKGRIYGEGGAAGPVRSRKFLSAALCPSLHGAPGGGGMRRSGPSPMRRPCGG